MNLRVISFSNQSLFMSSVLLFLLILIIFIFAYKLYQWQRYKLPPGPYPLPIIGNLHRVEPDTADCYEKWSRTYGPIMSVWFGSSLNVVVSSSELAKEVLKDRDEQLAHRYRNKPTDIMTQNGKKDLIWADYGLDYVKAKKVCALELFSPKRIEALRPIREDEVRTMIESIFIDCSHCTNSTTDDRNASKRLILRDYIGLATFNIITRLVFGKKLGDTGEQGLEFKAITEHELKHGASLIDHIWWLNWIIMLRSKAFSDHLARKDRLIRSIIDEHKMRKGKIGGYSEQHFVDALLSYQEKDGFSEETMKGLLWDLISAGIDTSAITVEWAMAELIKNSRVQNKLHQELDNVIGCNRTMSESDISKLPYLQCIVKEVLRLHPPTPLMLPHKASADVKVGGYDIPKGTIVHVNVRAIGHDPKKWKNPLKFRPERFLEEDIDMKGHDFRLLPFGAGRRMCPAAQLSINLVTSMIGHLVHHFWWSPPLGVEPEEIDMSGSPELVNYMKTPLQGVPILRLPTHLYRHIFN